MTSKRNIVQLILYFSFILLIVVSVEYIASEKTEAARHVHTLKEGKPIVMKVPLVMQNPELPNGCEITSLTAVLNYYGIDVSKLTMADSYLNQTEFTYQDGRRYGPDPHKAYAGNPRQEVGGWYVFAEPIVEAAHTIIEEENEMLTAINKSGATKEELLSFVKQEIPSVIWVTLDLSPPMKKGGWYMNETNDFHESYTNLHAVVLTGWEDGRVHVMNPLEGQVIYDENAFFKSYDQLGRHAVIVKKKDL
ncbi:C39 family peptidase [Lentibacillus saliphilus]|uniref:C39 family peptidase n=1 Tax=Lentibacillus saliphilus TaxID=2737028 RepID=UPI001C30C7F2|nr:C39 family peptidase [Lentibacillus saliphilus]